MPLLSRFGKGKKNEEASEPLEQNEEEEEGLLIATDARQSAPETGESVPVAGSDGAPEPEVVEDELFAAAQASAPAAAPGDAEAAEASLDADAEESSAEAPTGSDSLDAEVGDDLLEASAEVSTESASSGADPLTGGSGGGGDGSLDLFRDIEEESDLSHLLEGIEEIPIDELLAELREVQAMLGPAPADDEAAEAA